MSAINLSQKPNYCTINTIGDEREKRETCKKNNDMIKEILETLNNMVKDVNEIKHDVCEIKCLVIEKEQRDMNKWW
mgnify:CR=1 FL=1